MIAWLLGSQIARLALAAILALGVGYTWGRVDGRQAGKVQQLEATVEAMETRKGIDADVTNTDRYGLCLAAGGLPGDCKALIEEQPPG